MAHESILNFTIYFTLAVAVVLIFYWFLRLLAKDEKTGIIYTQKPGIVTQSKNRSPRKTSSSPEELVQTKREQLIAKSETIRQEMQQKLLTRYAIENPENTAKLLRTFLVDKSDRKK